MTKKGGIFVLFLLGTLIALGAFLRVSGVFAYQTGFSHPTLTQKAILLYLLGISGMSADQFSEN